MTYQAFIEKYNNKPAENEAYLKMGMNSKTGGAEYAGAGPPTFANL